MLQKNIKKFSGTVSRERRESYFGHGSAVFWFTGLSGAGKSTIAHLVEEMLFETGVNCYVLDGDNVRHGVCSDCDFSPEGRRENLRRIAEVAALFNHAGVVCLSAFISPTSCDREYVKSIVGEDFFHEIYIHCPLEECERRDVKGYYKLAREGKIKNYTGISSPYDEPRSPQLIISTKDESPVESALKVYEYILQTKQLASFHKELFLSKNIRNG